MSTEFYLSLHKKAEELFPKDEKAKNEYVEGFVTKIANVLDGMSEARQSFMRGIGGSVGKALVGGTLAAGFAGLMGAVGVVRSHALYNKYLQALNEARQSNSVLRAAESSKLLNFGNTIFKFAPHVATDPNLLSSILANAIHGDGLDPMTIRTLTELESRYQDTKGDGSFNPKTWT